MQHLVSVLCDSCCVRSERIVAVRRKWLQSTSDSTVHLRPQVSGHSSAGNHPREEHGDSAPTPDQQVLLHFLFQTHVNTLQSAGRQ